MYPNSIARKVISMEICRHMTYHLTYQAEVWHIICFRSFYYSEIWMHENKHTKQLIFKTCAKVNTLEICFICLSKNIYGQKTFGNKMCTTISSSGNSQISWFNKNNFLWTFEKTPDQLITATHIYNYGHNILEVHNISVQFRFATSKTKLDI